MKSIIILIPGREESVLSAICAELSGDENSANEAVPPEKLLSHVITEVLGDYHGNPTKLQALVVCLLSALPSDLLAKAEVSTSLCNTTKTYLPVFHQRLFNANTQARRLSAERDFGL